jgi:hypothetical protein
VCARRFNVLCLVLYLRERVRRYAIGPRAVYNNSIGDMGSRLYCLCARVCVVLLGERETRVMCACCIIMRGCCNERSVPGDKF